MKKQFPSSLKQSGFTLIELLVAITIMFLILGTGVVSYLQFNDRQALLAGVEELKTLLRTAQTRARLGDKPAGCDRLEAYAVQMAVDSSTARLVAICQNDSYQTAEIRLPGNTQLASAIDIQFRVLHGGVINPAEITLVSPFELAFSFQVSEGGQISAGSFD